MQLLFNEIISEKCSLHSARLFMCAVLLIWILNASTDAKEDGKLLDLSLFLFIL